MYYGKTDLTAYVYAFLITRVFTQTLAALQEPDINEEYGFSVQPPQGCKRGG